MESVINAYYGMFAFANTYNLRRKLYLQHFHRLQDYFYPQKKFTKMKLKPIRKLQSEGMIDL